MIWQPPRASFQREDYDLFDLLDTSGENSTGTYMLVLYGLIRSNGWKTLVEVGGYRGNTTAILARAAHMNGGGRVTVLEADTDNVDHLINRFVLQHSLTCSPVEIIQTRSQNAVPFPCDFVFVDDEHDAPAVIRNWEIWSPYVVPGGCMAFHDAAENPSVAQALSVLFPAPGWNHLLFPGDAGLLLALRI